ncbi:MAG: DNA replication and repair protein RecF [Sandaracinaceae bacterium]|nr:DNA replication and repair protein RecF [Sandaracinaceae bacterium]
MLEPSESEAHKPALRLERLSLRGWRNLAPLDLELDARFHVLAGDNGQGKSNLLEAIDYLATLRSFRGASTEDLIGRDVEQAFLHGRFVTRPPARTARVQLSRGAARELRLDDKRPRSTASWVASFQTVLFHPGDLQLASGSPETRRAFLDRILEEMDATYASTLAAYMKALRSRNRLLKREGVDPRSIRAFDELLASAGAVIGQSRAALTSDLAPLAEQAFHEVAGVELPLRVGYRPRVEPSVAALRAALGRSLEKDLARGFTAEGPHADDLALRVRGEHGARHHASQGQHRLIVLALKTAELAVLARRVGHTPMLLLDDVSSELDRVKNRRFFELLRRMGGQVLLTTTAPELIALDADRLDYRVVAGRVERTS